MKTKELRNGIVRITPDEGKSLYHLASGRYHSEVEVKAERVNEFEEISNND